MDIRTRAERLIYNDCVRKSGEVTLGRGKWGVDMRQGFYSSLADDPFYAEQTCCAIGAFLFNRRNKVGNVDEGLAIDAARKLGVSRRWILGFTQGFDGRSFTSDRSRHGFEAGRRVYRALQEEGLIA